MAPDASRLLLHTPGSIDFQALKGLIGGVDASKAECFDSVDKAMITSKIVKMCGSLDVLTMRLKLSLAERGFEMVVRKIEEEDCEDSADNQSGSDSAGVTVGDNIGDKSANFWAAIPLAAARVRAIQRLLEFADTNFVPPGMSTSLLKKITAHELETALLAVTRNPESVLATDGTKTLMKKELAMRLKTAARQR